MPLWRTISQHLMINCIVTIHSPKLLGTTPSKLFCLLHRVRKDVAQRLRHADIQHASDCCKDAKYKRRQWLPKQRLKHNVTTWCQTASRNGMVSLPSGCWCCSKRVIYFSSHNSRMPQTEMTELMFYVPPDTNRSFRRRSSQTISWLTAEKLKQTTK